MIKKHKSKRKTKKIEIKTVDQLIEEANEAASKMQLELAAKLFRNAHLLDSSDTNIMDALADMCIQIGEIDEALQLLLKSTKENPRENPFKWLFLAQLQQGLESVKSYKTGIEILNEQSEFEENMVGFFLLRSFYA
jgi:predicted Zn-dependent protease